MARLLVNDPVFNLMRNAVSSKSESDNFPAFIAVLESAYYWFHPDSNTKYSHFHNFIQLIFNKENYSKDANGLQEPLHYIFDRDFCKAMYPYRFLTLENLKIFLSRIDLPDLDRKFYENILLSQNDAKPYSYEELYNEVAIAKET